MVRCLLVEVLFFTQCIRLKFNFLEWILQTICKALVILLQCWSIYDSASCSCNVGPHLSFSRLSLLLHVDFSAPVKPQLTDQVLKIIFPNRDGSKHLPRGRKKPPKPTDSTCCFPHQARVFPFTKFWDKWSSCMLGTELYRWWIVCHWPQDLFILWRRECIFSVFIQQLQSRCWLYTGWTVVMLGSSGMQENQLAL